MSHKFNPDHKSKLDNEWRRQLMPPTETLKKLGLAAEDSVADVGCGIGYFSIPAAEIIDHKNTVYALDISPEMLQTVKENAQRAGVENVITIQTGEYDLKLPDAAVSFALAVNIIHEVEDHSRFLREIKRILQKQGKLAIIDWEKKPMTMGPPTAHRISADEMLSLLRENGFIIIGQQVIGEMFYTIQARRD